MNKDFLRRKLEEKKRADAIAQKKRQLQEMKEKRTAPATRIERPTRATQPVRPVRPSRPRVAESRVRPTPRVQGRVLENNIYKPKVQTLEEAVNKRIIKEAKGNKDILNTYNVLANNLVKKFGYQSLSEASKVLTETTQAYSTTHGALGGGAGVNYVKTYFDIFFGYFPDLITPLIASVQPLAMPFGQIAYYTAVAGTDKGKVKKGDKLITPFEVDIDRHYASEVVFVEGELDTKTVEGEEVEFWGGESALWQPYIARSVSVEGAPLTWSSDTQATGTLGTVGITVSATVSNNILTIEITGDDDLPENIEVSYLYDNVFAPTQIPEVNADVKVEGIQATPRTVKTNYSFLAGLGFEQVYGFSFDEKISDNATYLLKKTVDLDIVYAIMKSAPKTILWNKNAGANKGLYPLHKTTFVDALIEASNEIFNVSKRFAGNKILVGKNAKSIVEAQPEFVKGSKATHEAGGYLIGELKGFEVIAVPELQADDFAVLYKSNVDNWDAGVVFAPHIPITSTQPITLDDLEVKKAFITTYAVKVVNPNYFVRGKIINDEDKPTISWL